MEPNNTGLADVTYGPYSIYVPYVHILEDTGSNSTNSTDGVELGDPEVPCDYSQISSGILVCDSNNFGTSIELVKSAINDPTFQNGNIKWLVISDNTGIGRVNFYFSEIRH